MNDDLYPEELKQEQWLRDQLTSDSHRLEIAQREQLFQQLEKRTRRRTSLPWILPTFSAIVAALVLTLTFSVNTSEEVAPQVIITSIVDSQENAEPALEWHSDGRFEAQLASARLRLSRISPSTKSDKQLLDNRLSALGSNIASLRTRIN